MVYRFIVCLKICVDLEKKRKRIKKILSKTNREVRCGGTCLLLMAHFFKPCTREGEAGRSEFQDSQRFTGQLEDITPSS